VRCGGFFVSPEKDQLDFHVHDVLAMLAAEDCALTVAGLQQAVVEKFGMSARFSSCSADGMDAKEAIEFLFARQKFVECSPGQFKLNSGNSCGH
jgi:probable metal-binding protein